MDAGSVAEQGVMDDLDHALASAELRGFELADVIGAMRTWIKRHSR